MANKFTKSVLERQAKELKQQQREQRSAQSAETAPEIPSAPETAAPLQPPAPLAAAPESRSPLLEEAPVISAAIAGELPENLKNPESALDVSAPALETRAPRQNKAAVPDLGDYIIRAEERRAKNKTFYLDANVIDALKRAAGAQKVTESKLVNDILKRLLGV